MNCPSTFLLDPKDLFLLPVNSSKILLLNALTNSLGCPCRIGWCICPFRKALEVRFVPRGMILDTKTTDPGSEFRMNDSGILKLKLLRLNFVLRTRLIMRRSSSFKLQDLYY